MANPVWPSTLPQAPLAASLSMKRQDATVRFQPDVGDPIVRNRYTAKARTYTFNMIFSAAQLATFDTFFDTTLANGSLKFDWLDPVYAVQSHLGVSDGDFTMNADFLKNFDKILPRKLPGYRMPLYAGLGLKFKTEHDTFVGIRFVGGVSMFHSTKPIEFFMEVAPVLRVAPNEGATFDGAVGIRRYF